MGIISDRQQLNSVRIQRVPHFRHGRSVDEQRTVGRAVFDTFWYKAVRKEAVLAISSAESLIERTYPENGEQRTAESRIAATAARVGSTSRTAVE